MANRGMSGGACLAIWLGAILTWPTPAAAQAAGGDAPPLNVLWLVAEDLGVELACYGTRAAKTPNLDRLAAEGVKFTRAYSTAPVCSPSRSAWMTGMYQTTIGAHQHRSHRDDGYLLPVPARLVSHCFQDGGYQTLNLRELPAHFGFRGVGKTDWNFSLTSPAFDSDRWSDLTAHEPFFAQLNFTETHRPFQAPAQTDPAAVEIPPYYPDHPTVRADWAAYLDSLAELDRKVGVVLAELEASGLADRTLVVFFADNGQAHVRGKQFCYETGLHIPLIVRWPGGRPPLERWQPGSVSDWLIEAIDLAPTMLACCGLPVPPGMEGQVFLGPHAAPPREYVFGARDRCDETVFRFRTVRDARYRYIRNFMPERPFLQANEYKEKSYPVWNLLKELHAQGKLDPLQAVLCAPSMPAEELYDLETDPHETHNLAAEGEHAATLKRLRSALAGWMKSTGDDESTEESPDLAARKGVVNAKTPPNTGYALDEKTLRKVK